MQTNGVIFLPVVVKGATRVGGNVRRWLPANTATQQTRHIHPMLEHCCVSVDDGGPTMYQHWVNVSCLLLVGKAQSCCIVCIGLLTKHADWPKRSTARELTTKLTARELNICLNSTSMYNTRCLFAT